LKWLSAACTTVAVVAGLAIGGGLPPPPATLAREARAAQRNAAIAARNIARAESDTQALTTIAENVVRQVAASRRLLETQLEIEDASRSSARSTGLVRRRIGSLHDAIRSLGDRLEALSGDTEETGDQAGAAAGAARRLEATLRNLRARFDRLIEESRELNRKARGFQELQGGSG
jgi:hypothetical protein